MPAAERNAQLIAIAKDVVLIHGPDFYREYGEPVIEHMQMPPKGEQNPDGNNAGRYFYVVYFLYDRTQEILRVHFVARVAIWEDTGQPSGVLFGTGMGVFFENDNWRNAHIQTAYRQSPLFPIYDRNNPDPNQVPRNIDELTLHGFARDEYGQWVRTRPDEPPAEAQRVIRRAQEELRQQQAEREREGSDGRR